MENRLTRRLLFCLISLLTSLLVAATDRSAVENADADGRNGLHGLTNYNLHRLRGNQGITRRHSPEMPRSLVDLLDAALCNTCPDDAECDTCCCNSGVCSESSRSCRSRGRTRCSGCRFVTEEECTDCLPARDCNEFWFCRDS